MALGVRAIDTAYSYSDFASHSTLARNARDLLPEFDLATKVGFFPGTGRAFHSLDPSRLTRAIEQSVTDLGRAPDAVLLHNPERSLACLPLGQAREQLADACRALADAAAEGMCRSWGIATWDPRPLVGLVRDDVPAPDVLMVRAGLLVGRSALEAGQALAARFALPYARVRGMSPFGGSADSPVWNTIDPRIFLVDGKAASRLQAAFRVAYHLPEVGALAVGTDDPAHLRSLVDVLPAEIDEAKVARYIRLLRERDYSARPDAR